jgi:hypothetical protein
MHSSTAVLGGGGFALVALVLSQWYRGSGEREDRRRSSCSSHAAGDVIRDAVLGYGVLSRRTSLMKRLRLSGVAI